MRAGKFVLYILRTAFREAENPALETALHMASALGLPLVCVAVIEDAIPPNVRGACAPTDRKAAFKLEALRELQPGFAARGTVCWVQVQRDGSRAAVTLSLASKAALVLTDEHFGVEPHAAAAAAVARTGAPVWLCDAACTVPSHLLGSKALVGGNAAFLRATSSMRAERLAAGWMPPPAAKPTQPPPAPPEWSVDLSRDGAIEEVLSAPSRRDTAVCGAVSSTHRVCNTPTANAR